MHTDGDTRAPRSLSSEKVVTTAGFQSAAASGLPLVDQSALIDQSAIRFGRHKQWHHSLHTHARMGQDGMLSQLDYLSFKNDQLYAYNRNHEDS